MSKRIVRKKNSPNRMLFFVFLLVFIGGIVFFFRSSFFTVESVYVEGASKVDKNEVLTVCGIQQGENIFDFSAKKAQESIKTITNVKNASVVRIYPNTVKIVVTERVPFMVICSDGNYIAIDDTGKVLSVANALNDSSGVIVSGLSGISASPGDQFDFMSNVSVQTADEIFTYLKNESLYDYVSELHVSSNSCYYLYTKKSNVIKFYSLSAFTSNEDFIKLFLENEDRQIMVEVIEGCNPVYKTIDIK
ncbi:MAG: cell division protein FtsQ/DivIB [Anaerofustis sp.]